jgi:hypothetical protein
VKTQNSSLGCGDGFPARDLLNHNSGSHKAYGSLYFADPARTSSPPLTLVLSTEQHRNPSGSVMLTENVAHAVR